MRFNQRSLRLRTAAVAWRFAAFAAGAGANWLGLVFLRGAAFEDQLLLVADLLDLDLHEIFAGELALEQLFGQRILDERLAEYEVASWTHPLGGYFINLDVPDGTAQRVVQLAKEAGCKVIASAGSEAKLAFLRDIGADVVFNYKTEDMTEVLKREGPINLWVCSSTGLRAPSCFP